MTSNYHTKTICIFLFLTFLGAHSALARKENKKEFIKTEFSSADLENLPNPFIPQIPMPPEPEPGPEPETEPEPEPIKKMEKGKPNPNLKVKVPDKQFKIPKIVPPKIKVAPTPSVILSGIIWNSDRPQAIIDGEIFDVGDSFQHGTYDYEIMAITKGEVHLSSDGQKMTIVP